MGESRGTQIIRLELNMQYWRLALLNTRRNTRRSVLAISLMAVGTAALIINSGIITFIFGGLRDDAIYGRFGHLQLYQQGYLENYRRDPFAYLVPMDEYVTLSSLAKSVPQVVSVTAELSVPIMIYTSGRASAANAMGEESGVNLRTIRIVQGKSTLSDDTGIPTVLVGRGLAEKLQVNLGDVMTLIARGANQSSNAIDVLVGGIFEEGFRDYDDWSLKAPLEVTQYLVGVKGVEKVLVFLNNAAATDKARQNIARLANSKGFLIDSATWYELAIFYRQVIAMFGKELRVIMIIVEAVAWFGIVAILWMIFTERQREMAALLCMGMSRVQLSILFVQEGGWLGLAGAVAGVVSGLLIAKATSVIGIPMPPPPGSTRDFVAQVALSPAKVLIPASLTFLTALAASIVPSIWIWRLDIARNLRPAEG